MDVVADRVLGRIGFLVGVIVGWFLGWSWWDKMLMEFIFVFYFGLGFVVFVCLLFRVRWVCY